ncbi:acyl-CoA dehydrogenase family protein [Microbacteriaceae bacterium 4G12]
MGHWIFSEEHDLFRKTIQKFISKEITPHIEEWEKTKAIPKDVFQTIGGLGYLGISISEYFDGSDLDSCTEAILSEELTKAGAASLALLIFSHINSLRFIHTVANEEVKQSVLSEGVKGKKIGTLALQETTLTTVDQTEHGYVLNGSKANVYYGQKADYFIVSAKVNGATSLFVVDAKTNGIHVKQEKSKFGWHSLETAEITFTNVIVPYDHLLGEVGKGDVYIGEYEKWQQVLTALNCVSLAEKALEAAIQYSKQRIQFGKPLASFQALRHKMADMAIIIEKARNISYRSLYLYEKDCSSKAFLAAATIAKKTAMETANQVCDDALQIHGGAGYMMEFPVQRYWRDAKMYAVMNQAHSRYNASLIGWLNERKGREASVK